MEDSMSHYMPHGHCYLWEPALVGTHVVSDLLIGLAYLSISISLYLLIRKIKMPFSPIVLAFGVFIGACGMTHFMEIWTLWHPDYWASAGVKVLTALASVATGIALIRLSPKIVGFARAAKLSEERGVKLEAAYNDMEARVQQRTHELELASKRERQAKEQIEALYVSAQKSSRLKDEFLATMSHELRTPLSVILGYTELLEDGELSEEEERHAISTIRRNSITQFQLVKDLLDVSMIISGKMQLNAKLVDVKTAIEDAMESVNLAAKAKDIKISLLAANPSYSVLGDSTRLQQIIWNLLSNAIKFTDKGGKIDVRIFTESSRCHIEVSDSGHGIDPNFLPHVFERFRQEDASSSRKHGGLGLGLAIVRHLAELHGGSVHAHSDGIGKGARFLVTLPMAAFQASEATALVNETGSIKDRLKGTKVLVVDDERDVRDLIASFLQKQGLTTETAGSAKEALTKLSIFVPNVLVCDIGMPETDGYSLIRTLREQEIKNGGFLPAIALTAYAQEGVKQKVLASGFQAYLTKPAESEALLLAIGQLIE